MSAHPAPQRDRVSLAALLFGIAAAPLFWLGQMMLGFGVTAYVCYPGDHPLPPPAPGALPGVLIGFDVVALIACAVGGIVSYRSWLLTRSEKAGSDSHALHTGEGRTRFMALWGIIASLWFFAAILFNTIASLTVSPCVI